ncbi:MAG: acyl-CoA reductase [Flavobacteriaceae bacterium]
MNSHLSSITSFSALGQLFRDYTAEKSSPNLWIEKLDNALVSASNQNKWFTKENLDFCLRSWGNTLTENNIATWLSQYPAQQTTKRLGLVLAGNIPLVGLHDVLCGLACGYRIEVKFSSNDAVLLPFVVDFLCEIQPEWQGKIHFTDGKLTQFDRVIATGSNNTARYFQYYFKDVPHIVRQTRNGVAVLDGTESEEDLKALCIDIMQYFGLGCRSVSHLMVPKGYDFNLLFLALYEHREIIHHNAYANNYDYNKAVYLMQEEELLENGFVMLKKDNALNSPIACVHYSTYSDITAAEKSIEAQQEHIQCVVSTCLKNSLPFGQTQHPKLNDYADHVDTMAFLLKK